ncbi:MAG TPA: metal-dependent hydrolase [Pseudonocardiaceae bacterium]
MSTGPTHAVMGLAAWGAVALLAGSRGIPVDVPTWLAGAALTSGAALLPDLDHPPATVSRSFGPVTKVVSHGVDFASVSIYNLTRLKGDPHRNGGHRTFTHTVVFAALAGTVTTSLVRLNNPWVTAALLFFFAGLGVRGLLHEWDHAADTFVVVVLSLLVTWQCWQWVHTGTHRAEWFGVAVIAGCLAHCVGDTITEDGCPFLWPLPIGRHLWYPIGTPKPMRYRTGGRVEMVFVGPLCTVLSVWLAALALQGLHIFGWLDHIPLVPHIGVAVASH